MIYIIFYIIDFQVMAQWLTIARKVDQNSIIFAYFLLFHCVSVN